jgi:hypothetical protein
MSERVKQFKRSINTDPVVLEWRAQIAERFIFVSKSLESEAMLRGDATPLQFHYANYVVLMEMAALAAMAHRENIRSEFPAEADLLRDDFLRNAGRCWDKFETDAGQQPH